MKNTDVNVELRCLGKSSEINCDQWHILSCIFKAHEFFTSIGSEGK
ncbi:MAG: hypothetical protein ACFFDB_05730 [Promethearchaeota archaeon]